VPETKDERCRLWWLGVSSNSSETVLWGGLIYLSQLHSLQIITNSEAVSMLPKNDLAIDQNMTPKKGGLDLGIRTISGR
jgi:hypothetical protein